MANVTLQSAMNLQEGGRLDTATEAFRDILTSNPSHLEALYSLAVLYMQTGQFQAALENLDRLLSLQADFPHAAVDRATVLLQLKRLDEALVAFDAALVLDQNNPVAWNNRGNVFLAMKHYDEALANYDRALGIRPGFDLAVSNRETALLGLKRATRCPSLFLRRTFDDAAGEFEEAMAKLTYRAHLDLRLLADRIVPPGGKRRRILDLGSGTGLVGEAFKDLADGGRLDGIDLSPLMIEEARKRGIYSRLILGDLETVLAGPLPHYDLVLAGDTMIYMGDLSLSFGGAWRCLAAGGFFLFSVEKKTNPGWEQTDANRFRHSDAYVREEAARTGFAVAETMECILRYEAGQPVRGLCIGLHKSMDS